MAVLGSRWYERRFEMPKSLLSLPTASPPVRLDSPRPLSRAAAIPTRYAMRPGMPLGQGLSSWTSPERGEKPSASEGPFISPGVVRPVTSAVTSVEPVVTPNRVYGLAWPATKPTGHDPAFQFSPCVRAGPALQPTGDE